MGRNLPEINVIIVPVSYLVRFEGYVGLDIVLIMIIHIQQLQVIYFTTSPKSPATS